MGSSSISAEADVVQTSLPLMRARKKVSLVHHWMEHFRGGEAVLEQFGLLFPDAPISILVYNKENLSPSLQKHHYHTSFLQKNRFLKKHFRKLLPLFPAIVPSLHVPLESRFVLSTDASLIKGIHVPEGARHACYCHSPPRYLWGMEDSYLESASQNNRLGRFLFSAAAKRLRRFDWQSAQKVDRFIANSCCVQERILRCYGRESVVIHPPVSLERFDHTRPREDFYLVVSALVPYKYVQIAVDACTRLNRRLVVIGTGPEEAALRKRAGKGVTFLGWQTNASVQDHYERCRAFLFPGIEDFGITPCEAQASGAPVIAYGEGGALETVKNGVSGLFFSEQTTEGMIAALKHFESLPDFAPDVCRANVADLSPARFRAEMRDFLGHEFPDIFSAHDWPDDPEYTETTTEVYRESFRAFASPGIEIKSAEAEPAATPAASGALSVVEVVEPGEGGVFRHVEGLIDVLLSRGVKVHLAYSDRRGSRRLHAVAERVRRSGGKVLNLRVINYPEFCDAVSLFRLRRFVAEVRPDIIHGHSSKAGALARVVSFLYPKATCFYTPHAYYGMSNQPHAKVPMFTAVERILSHIGKTINISEDEAKFGRKTMWLSPKRQNIIANPVALDRFHPPSLEQRRAARAALGFGVNDVVIGMVGRMGWQKDPETAYHAMGPVLQRHPEVKFVHLGWGKWKDYLLSLAEEYKVKDRVKILDYTEDTVSFYHGIDALLVTSRYEAGWPFVVLEALGCDLPIVAATCQGMSDIGGAGLSHLYPFNPEDRAGCTQAIEAWLETRSAPPLPCNHRDYAKTHFSVEACHGAVLDLYLSHSPKFAAKKASTLQSQQGRVSP